MNELQSFLDNLKKVQSINPAHLLSESSVDAHELTRNVLMQIGIKPVDLAPQKREQVAEVKKEK